MTEPKFMTPAHRRAFNEVATDVFQEAKREHFYPDADDDEIAEIRRRWQPYLDLLPEYRSSCRAFHIAE